MQKVWHGNSWVVKGNLGIIRIQVVPGDPHKQHVVSNFTRHNLYIDIYMQNIATCRYIAPRLPRPINSHVLFNYSGKSTRSRNMVANLPPFVVYFIKSDSESGPV